ncbi:16S rRNA (cytidine(1402)-2'-O)-methyltransferase [Pelagibacterales bacterium]|nr:16S rRNA (cytidine(1402)-2'-O)-methyltransferase [Pelagibacterales bacterium]MDB9986069.1 16S rRNA (cytidine(1402)-2'-O)-methyltransferase [Pelagibacterales bacterium]
MDLNIDTKVIIDQINKNNFLPGLYIVSTPIGNLADISIRSLSALSLSSFILCEDTRTSKKLTTKYGIKNKLKAFHKFNSTKEMPDIINKLKAGLMISMISDAGTPLISDPGESLVNTCIDEKIPIYSIPGASSVLGSIVISGIDTSKFTFLGFFPQNQKLKESFFERILYSNETVIIFESPKRLKKLLLYFINNLSSRKIAVIRELTKKNEEVVRGVPQFVYDKFKERLNIKGEVTIIIEGADLNKKNQFNNEEIITLINLYKLTLTDKEIVIKISDKLNISKRVIYQLMLDNK